jgi:hypothetical protein
MSDPGEITSPSRNTCAPARSACITAVLLLSITAAGACGSNDPAPPSNPTSPDSGLEGGAAAPAWLGLKGERMPPLPAQQPAQSAKFTTADQCAQCHAANDQSTALRDAKGRDVSPASSWRASVMANAARDPFYLSAFSHEIATHAGATAAVEQTCVRCHAPEADVEARAAGGRVTFAQLTTATTPEAHLGREGVACSLCHQIAPDNLGDVSSFTGGFVMNDLRAIFGPHQNPSTGPMQTFVSYTPTYSLHMTESRLCATCHTVITRAIDAKGNPVGIEFAEQASYLEWQNSAYNTEGTPGAKAQSCQGCHVPVLDDDGAPINTVLATYKNVPLSPRSPLGQHRFVGGNGYALRLFSENTAWMGTKAPAPELAAQGARSDEMVKRAARVTVKSAKRAGADAEVVVFVENLSGHKFPTGYPSRRAWLHVTLSRGADVLFDSGAFDAYGRLVDRRGKVLDAFGAVLAHKDAIESDADVQVYESVPGDLQERPTSSLLDAFRYVKDNRLMPIGFDRKHKNMLYATWVGINGDPNFGSEDEVTYRLKNAPAGALHVRVELLYQSVRPADLEALAKKTTPATLSFFDMVGKRAPLPLVVGTVEVDVN